jgi:formylglycine-generating enzyme required for sulfatase activity
VYGTGNDQGYCDTSANSSYSQIVYSDGVFTVGTKDGRDMSDDPMVQVSWYGAVAYCNWRSGEEGKESCYNLSTWDCDFTKHGYRLATEAEWEYAAHGGNHSPYYRYAWGDSIDGSKANYWDSGDPYETGDFPWTTPVGYYDASQIPAGSDMANGYGLYDMTGNLWEWCNDWYDENYYDVSPYDNPTGPASGSYRVFRGGGWGSLAAYCRVAYRLGDGPAGRYSIVGFRIVLDLE